MGNFLTKMKFNKSKIYYISLVFFLIIHAKMFTATKLKTFGNIITPTNTTKIQSNVILEIDNLKNNLNLSSNSFYENSNPLIENTKTDEIEKSISDISENEINVNQNEKINTITKEDNLAKDDLIVKLKDLEKIVAQNLLKNSPNANFEKIEENNKSANTNTDTNTNTYKTNTNSNINTDTYSNTNIDTNRNTNTNRNLMKKENTNKVDNDNSDLVMDYFQNIYIDEFLSVKSDKRQYLEDNNVFVFYNSLSLVMLSMLGGGVLGLLFILFFSYKDENHKMLR